MALCAGPSAGSAQRMAGELKQRVSAFRSGRDPASGSWLVSFQGEQGAWQICMEALRAGPSSDLDGEFLDAFCAQSLATFARGLLARCSSEAECRSFRAGIEPLLAAHLPPRGRPAVWKQLCLALVCADLWLAAWSPAAALGAAASLPGAVLKELLSLPPELLFCDRALPLGDVRLWQAAAGALYEGSGPAFAYLLGDSASDAAAASQSLQVLANWLRATRLSFEWLEGVDPALPLRALATQRQRLIALAEVAPAEAAEVAQQLARWRRCDSELLPVLRPLLDRLLPLAAAPGGPLPQLLPLLADLASDRWPRAAMGGEPEVSALIDLQLTAEAALAFVRSTGNEGGDASDAEAALAVWNRLADTLRYGTQEWEDEAERGGGLHSEWWAPAEQVAQAAALPTLFGLFGQELLRLLQLPSLAPQQMNADLKVLWEARAVAQSSPAAWASLVGGQEAWQEATWAPLKGIATRLAAGGSDELLAREAEVVLWFSFTLAASWPERAGSAPAAAAVLEFADSLDRFPPPWRALLWTQACSLASTAPAAQCPRLIEWMLQRPPQAAGSPELLEFTELPYASALEMACRQLPADGPAHAAVAERFLTLALEVPTASLHGQSSEAKALLLRAMRHVMGGEVASLCRGLAERVLPTLRQAAEIEASGAQQGSPAHAARVLLAALRSVLPKKGTAPVLDIQHPAVLLWRDQWQCLEAPLLRWPSFVAESSNAEQPLTAAAEAVSAAASALPVLLPEALDLLVRAASEGRGSHEVPLAALESVLQQLPCPPLEPAAASELVGGALLRVVEALLPRPDLHRSPATLTALYSLLARGLLEGRASLCGGGLRLRLLSKVSLTARLLSLFCEALPGAGAASAVCAQAMLRFAVRLVPKAPPPGSQPLEATATEPMEHRSVLLQALPSVCAATCRALAEQEHLARFESGFLDAAELLYYLAEAFPAEIAGALSAGLQSLQGVPQWSRDRLLQYVQRRREWPKRSAWIAEIQNTVQEWQRERKQAHHQLAT
ncbi:unnamed protein product [Polarella glacialis]|uniref:Uncharacterized protein n=1 Tax=Polarella glacialis TaxID=89957 RepID=A0A813H8X1_POLGL|nr:unnamed protein product [Polarella glacialis]